MIIVSFTILLKYSTVSIVQNYYIHEIIISTKLRTLEIKIKIMKTPYTFIPQRDKIFHVRAILTFFFRLLVKIALVLTLNFSS